jgi:hypothetical protein
MKKRLIKLSFLPVLGLATLLSTPTHSTAQTQIEGCPDGSFTCTCNGRVSCQTTIEGCWNSC